MSMVTISVSDRGPRRFPVNANRLDSENLCTVNQVGVPLRRLPNKPNKMVKPRRVVSGLLTLAIALFFTLQSGLASASTYSCSWNTSTSADWSTAGDWSNCNGASPNNGGADTFDAAIALGGTYTVSLTAPITIGTLTMNANGATLSNSSTLSTTGGVLLQAGTLSGGTYAATGGGTTAIASSSGTLNNVTLNGSLDLTGNYATAYFNGLTVKDVTGSSAGVINVTGTDAGLYSTATQTLDNATVHLGGTSGYGRIYAQTGTTLTATNLTNAATGTVTGADGA